jgi:hypothetical protein
MVNIGILEHNLFNQTAAIDTIQFQLPIPRSGAPLKTNASLIRQKSWKYGRKNHLTNIVFLPGTQTG